MGFERVVECMEFQTLKLKKLTLRQAQLWIYEQGVLSYEGNGIKSLCPIRIE